MNRPSCLIALYHALQGTIPAGYSDALPLEDFQRQIAWLRQHYQIVSLATLFQRQAKGQSLAGLAAITFDDGHASLAPALRWLAAEGLPATLFLVGDLLAGRPYWRDQVRSLVAQERVEAFLGFARDEGLDTSQLAANRFYRDSKDTSRCDVALLAELVTRFLPPGPSAFFTRHEIADLTWPGLVLGNHSQRHLPLSALSPDAQRRDIVACQAALPAPKAPILALPFGNPGSYDQRTLDAALAAGMENLVLVSRGLCDAQDLRGHSIQTAALTRCQLGKERQLLS